MGLATIYPHSQKEHAEIHKIPKFDVNRATRNVWKSGQIPSNVRNCPDFHTFFVNNIQATISAFSLVKSISIDPKSVQKSEIECKKVKLSAKKVKLSAKR